MQDPETLGGVSRSSGVDHPDQTADGAFIAPETPEVASADQHVLKSGDTFIVNDPLGDITGIDDGLFVNDTRVLSSLRLTFGGRVPSLLSGSVSSDNTAFTAHFTNRPLPPLGGTSTPEGVIHVERERVLSGTMMTEAIELTNYGTEEAVVPLSISFASDFRDMFEVRGLKREVRGELKPPRVEGSEVRLEYIGLDKVARRVSIEFSPKPDKLLADRADFTVALPAQACVSLYLTVAIEVEPLEGAAPDTPSAGIIKPDYCLADSNGQSVGRAAIRAALVDAHILMRERRRRTARVRSSNPLFNSWINRSIADLSLLTTDLPTGPYPYAGIPWFSTPFGRDAIITSLQTLWLQPALARGVLRFLAAHQAREDSAFRDAEVGKIMHELRKSEMAATGEVPFALYYGGVDSTPLFVVLAGAYVERTGDLALIDELWPALERAAGWVAGVCDRNPHGLLDYRRESEGGLANQGWKDSHDSVFHADGRFPDGPIALVEVQAYASAAFETMSRFATQRGLIEDAARYAGRAAKIRRCVEEKYWMPESEFYGIALDGHGDLCRVLASNAGHLLAFGLPEYERGRAVAEILESALFHTGWGVRTLAAGQARFNPMAYHNGSVWPHDNALCARGLARYGRKEAAVRLLQALFEAAVTFDMRLPELFCGFPRRRGSPPTAYPVACLPQAWAAGSPFMMLEACLGVSIDATRREVRIEQPMLPEGIDWLEVGHLRVGNASVTLTFRRVDGKVVASADRSDVKVVAVL
ncbi:MAG: amylo-alpha-1,6-glucosidase [Paraburkholderia tropica]|uniref:Glycogen debranching enzyme n=1 Tax=Paraburkholderia tropica TaxID=92647 RepID=A0ABX5MTP8_9BURK|nr:amylo-alpha-1,6-glucosidase [Paraburkholderia tropica]MBB2999058.1 glycogen debranching enzyme [Paraburkholderia tropica]MBB6319042.1 glycogen debranching enzyme [Paraburkholderia tropica]MDE1138789.1 amylo-alpha-1,6-glucosidase [Paraburkholderia tropica]PXX18845.1 glycogen debranching enzyme [Paraburkholderia tropica]PZW87377.1 glycogen debranching enzyme [Paraburkholderia tropica]